VAFNKATFKVTESYINKMRDTMAHRGPDGAGTWVSGDGRVGLGHRRLAIIDLSESAAQPMSNEDGTLWISFNGEIYNHAEIRRELEQRGGHRWKTDHSDTEVIIHAFEEWGIDCLQRFRGMFAIALWDSKNRELWLMRDRIGIKPLYYSFHHGRLAFASEIKALLQDPDQPRAMDEEAFYHFLSFLSTPAPFTLFAGIKKLPGGTWLRIRENGDLFQQCYWDVWEHTTPLCDVSEEEIAARLLGELRTAVNLRKVSDVPVGVFLSGGLDSSTNAALFSEGEGRPVRTFSIGYQGDYKSYPNELSYARKMADLVGAEYHERLLTMEDLLDFLPRMVYLQDEPIADPVCVPVYYVSKLARDNGVIVCQVGEGADELFCGYPGWQNILSLQKLNDRVPGKWPKRLAVELLDRFDGFHDSFKLEYLRRASIGQPIFWGGAEAFSELQKKRLLHPRLRQKFANYSSWEMLEPIYRRFQEKAWEKSHLNWMSYLDLNLRLPELLLMRVDKMSMGVSLEGRVPFLDHKFVELAMSIPEAIKIKNDNLKYILKKAVRGLIPDEFIDRKKQGFGVPVYEWYSERLGDKIRQEIMEFCEETDFLDSTEVLRMLRRGNGAQLWYLLNLAMWWKQFILNSGSGN
jgi:asparagine synthase (glutamine-hydrolysing)